jgi:hypothetical protein
MNDYPSRESGMSLMKPILAIYTSGISRPGKFNQWYPRIPGWGRKSLGHFNSVGKFLLTFYKVKKFFVWLVENVNVYCRSKKGVNKVFFNVVLSMQKLYVFKQLYSRGTILWKIYKTFTVNICQAHLFKEGISHAECGGEGESHLL